MDPAAAIPLWVKLAATAFVAVLVPVYWRIYGPGNFLWFSDIALFTTVAALWLESPLLASMMVLAIGLPETAWNLDFFWRLATRRGLFGMADYMFDAGIPRFVRALSLFHVWMPALLLWMIAWLGYDRRAWVFQSLVALVVFPLSRAVTPPAENVNWVHGPGSAPKPRGWLWVGFLVAFFSLVVYSLTHVLMLALF
jgi:hypothetical protein